MHIGLDGIPLAFPKTGVGHYTFELAQALSRLSPNDHFELLYPSTFAPIVAANSPQQRLKLTRVPVGPVGRHWWSTGLPRYIRRSKLELFHGTNFDIPLWRRCATVLTIHDLSQWLYPETHEKRSVRRARRRLPLMARTADAIITPTAIVRREVCEHLKVSPEKVFAVPEAARDCFRPMDFATTEEVRRKLGIGDRFLLTVGTVEPRKNMLVLVAAFERVIRELREGDLQLVIVGCRGWLSDPLFAAIEKSPARARIVLTDYLHDQYLRALYASCRAFIYPSIYEGFGLPPLEAMACGSPVIVSRIPALEETTGDAAMLFNHTSESDLAEKILGLVTDENATERLSDAGLKRASQFSWERTAQLTLDVYNTALAKAGNFS